LFPFGVTFYPDQWPKEIWEKEFLRISESGFNAVRFGEMAWNWVEPKEGEFNFKDLDEAMNVANKYGIKVILGIGTSQAPPWLIKKYPDVRPVAHDGTLYPEYGPRPNICRDNLAFKKLAERYVRKIVKRYHKHPALLMWQIDNEPVYPPLDVAELKDYCHCPATRDAFISWAKGKYGSIEEANRVWGAKFWTAEFSDFSEVTPPRGGMWDAVSPHIFLDWFRFKTESLHNWLMWMKGSVSEIDKSHKIGTNGFIGICPRVPDHDKMAEGLDWYGWDIYPAGGRLSPRDLSMMADLWRSYTFERDTEFHVTELQGGQNVRWGFSDYVKGPEIRLWTHEVIAHGAKALLYHAWRPPLFGSEIGGFGILSTSGGRTERLDAIEKAGSEIKSISEVLNEHKLIPQVAIAYLRDGEVETYQEQGPPRAVAGQWASAAEDIGIVHALDSMGGAYSVLWNYFNPAAFIFERHLDGNSLPFQAILLPNPYLLKEKAAKVLKKYVYDGGILITEARFGLKNENGHLNEKPLIESLVDVKYDHTEVIGDDLEIPELDLEACGFRDMVSAKEGVVLKFSDGTPAIIEKKVGRGKIIYATFSLFLSLKKDPGNKAVEYLRGHLPSPSIKIDGSEKVEVVFFEDTTPIAYAINHGDEKAEITLTVPNKFKIAKELLKKGDVEVADGKVSLKFDGREVKVLHLLQKKEGE
jgi:beta-galactosidase